MAEEEPKKSRAGWVGGIAGAAVSAFASLKYVRSALKSTIISKQREILRAAQSPEAIAEDAGGILGAVKKVAADNDLVGKIDETFTAVGTKLDTLKASHVEKMAELKNTITDPEKLVEAQKAASKAFRSAGRAIKSEGYDIFAGAISSKMSLLEKVNSLSKGQIAAATVIFAGGTLLIGLGAKRLFGQSKDKSHVENLETQRLSHAQGAGLSA